MAEAVTTEQYPDAYEAPDGGPSAIPLPKLFEILQSDNAVDLIDQNEAKNIGTRCVEEYKIDLESRTEWWEKAQEGIKLAKQVADTKNDPWPGCANVKYPLMAEAAISFAARAYPELVKGDVVQAEVVGQDPDGNKERRAARVSDYMSYQLRYKMPYWEEETDLLLVQLPLIGSVFRKSYYDHVDGKTCSHLVSAENFVVNHNIKSLSEARRETEILELWGNDVEERFRSGMWARVEMHVDERDGIPQADKPYTFLEQHRWLDLDGDGYEEPYVVTVHESTSSVVRIAPRFDFEDVTLNQNDEVVRIEGDRHYTHYGFMPNPDGGLYCIGLGSLLLPINEAVNTILNQLLDAGTLSNVQGGFLARGVRTRAGSMRFKAGEWKTIDTGGMKLSEAVHALPVKEPSQTLFALLGMLVDAGKSLANLKDVLTGDVNPMVQPTTLMAMIEQGQKVYSAIYKRIYRAMTAEFKLLFKLNRMFIRPEQYRAVLDEQADPRQDFNSEDYDICPVADPTVSSQTQRIARAQALMQMKDQPGMNAEEIIKEYLEAIGITNHDRFYSAEAAKQSGSVQQELVMQNQDLQDREQSRKERETQARIEKMASEEDRKNMQAMQDAYTRASQQAQDTIEFETNTAVKVELDALQAERDVLLEMLGVMSSGVGDASGAMKQALVNASGRQGIDALRALNSSLRGVLQ